MLKEWLIETVGLEKDRAESIAEKFIACGCVDLTTLSKRNRGHDNHHPINILDIELEEWEATLLSSAIDGIVLDDDFFSSDSAFKLEKWYDPRGVKLSSTRFDSFLLAELREDIACAESAEDMIDVAMTIIHEDYAITFAMMSVFCNTIRELSQRSIIHQDHMLTTSISTYNNIDSSLNIENHHNMVVPPVLMILRLCIQSHHNGCVIAALKALQALTYRHINNQTILCNDHKIAHIIVERLLSYHPKGGGGGDKEEKVKETLRLLDILSAHAPNVLLLPLFNDNNNNDSSGSSNGGGGSLIEMLYILIKNYASLSNECVSLVLSIVGNICHSGYYEYHYDDVMKLHNTTSGGTTITTIRGSGSGTSFPSFTLQDILDILYLQGVSSVQITESVLWILMGLLIKSTVLDDSNDNGSSSSNRRRSIVEMIKKYGNGFKTIVRRITLHYLSSINITTFGLTVLYLLLTDDNTNTANTNTNTVNNNTTSGKSGKSGHNGKSGNSGNNDGMLLLLEGEGGDGSNINSNSIIELIELDVNLMRHLLVVEDQYNLLSTLCYYSLQLLHTLLLTYQQYTTITTTSCSTSLPLQQQHNTNYTNSNYNNSSNNSKRRSKMMDEDPPTSSNSNSSSSSSIALEDVNFLSLLSFSFPSISTTTTTATNSTTTSTNTSSTNTSNTSNTSSSSNLSRELVKLTMSILNLSSHQLSRNSHTITNTINTNDKMKMIRDNDCVRVQRIGWTVMINLIGGSVPLWCALAHDVDTKFLVINHRYYLDTTNTTSTTTTTTRGSVIYNSNNMILNEMVLILTTLSQRSLLHVIHDNNNTNPSNSNTSSTNTNSSSDSDSDGSSDLVLLLHCLYTILFYLLHDTNTTNSSSNTSGSNKRLITSFLSQNTIEKLCQLLSYYHSHTPLMIHIPCLACLVVLLQHTDASRFNNITSITTTPPPATTSSTTSTSTMNDNVCVALIKSFLFWNQFNTNYNNYNYNNNKLVVRRCLLLQYNLHCLQLLASYPAYRIKLVVELRLGQIILDFLSFIILTEPLTSQQTTQHNNTTTTNINVNVNNNSTVNDNNEDDDKATTTTSTTTTILLPPLRTTNSSSYPSSSSSSYPSPSKTAKTTTTTTTTTTTITPMLLSFTQRSSLGSVAMELLANLSLESSNRIRLIQLGLAKLTIRSFLQVLRYPALTCQAPPPPPSQPNLLHAIVHLLVILAEENRILLGELGVCEAIAFCLHKHLPILNKHVVMSIEEEGGGGGGGGIVDDKLIQGCCQCIYNLCYNKMYENQLKCKQYGILLILQLLIEKYYMLISKTTRIDVKDAINAIRLGI